MNVKLIFGLCVVGMLLPLTAFAESVDLDKAVAVELR